MRSKMGSGVRGLGVRRLGGAPGIVGQLQTLVGEVFALWCDENAVAAAHVPATSNARYFNGVGRHSQTPAKAQRRKGAKAQRRKERRKCLAPQTLAL